MSDPNIPISCDLTALPDRAAHEQTSEAFLAQIIGITEHETGYAVELPIDALSLAADFIDGERRCCPFLTFDLHIGPASDRFSLQIGGSDDIKAFLQQELLSNLPTQHR